MDKAKKIYKNEFKHELPYAEHFPKIKFMKNSKISKRLLLPKLISDNELITSPYKSYKTPILLSPKLNRKAAEFTDRKVKKESKTLKLPLVASNRNSNSYIRESIFSPTRGDKIQQISIIEIE